MKVKPGEAIYLKAGDKEYFNIYELLIANAPTIGKRCCPPPPLPIKEEVIYDGSDLITKSAAEILADAQIHSFMVKTEKEGEFPVFNIYAAFVDDNGLFLFEDEDVR
jgi:hypothetical protein